VGPSPPPSPAPPTLTRRSELSDFLRTRRAELTPDAVGIVDDGRRRTPGLRREEVAQLAGVGLSWYTWLEQGREIRPSPQVLDALARVLRLDAAERAHLFHLARVELPLTAAVSPSQAPPELEAFVQSLLPHPAFLLNARADVLAWNRAAAAVIADFGAVEPARRNLLWILFTEMDPERRGPSWEATAKNALARFRAEHARRVDDPGFAELVAELTLRSPQFRDWWPRHEVLSEQAGTKSLDHPRLGPLRMHHLQSIPSSHQDLRLVLYVPADEVTRATLATV
jgi:transcriptional regulator with XRE-family HTH domain